MLKRVKRWYADSPRHQRYGWGLTISGIIGVAAFSYKMLQGVGFSQSFNWGVGLFGYPAMFALVFPQGIVDLIRGYGKHGKSYWKHGSRLDEMEKRIFRRARELSLMAFYGYIGAALLGVMSYYGAIGSDQVPIKLLQTTLLSGIFVLVWSQGVALVVLYSLQGKAANLLDY